MLKKGTLLAHSLADDKRRRKTTDGKNALQHDIKERQQTMHNAVDAPFRCLIIVRSPVQVRASPPEKTPSQAGFFIFLRLRVLLFAAFGTLLAPFPVFRRHRLGFPVFLARGLTFGMVAVTIDRARGCPGCPNGPLRERVGTGPERDARIPVACPCRTVEPCPSRTVSPTFC